jgi:hypothetical protein
MSAMDYKLRQQLLSTKEIAKIINMKQVQVGDVFLWMGKLVQAQWMNQGHKSVGFVTNESVVCPHCQQEHSVVKAHDIIVSSPLFQENAEPVTTLTNERQ